MPQPHKKQQSNDQTFDSHLERKIGFNREVTQTAKKPIAIFAIDRGPTPLALSKVFSDSGIHVVFVRTTAEIFEWVARRETFCIFLSTGFGGLDPIRTIKHLRSDCKASIVAVAPPLSTQRRTALIVAGANDILTQPVAPALCKMRAFGQLQKFLQTYGMPTDITLPPGFKHNEYLISRPPVQTDALPFPATAPAKKVQKPIATTARSQASSLGKIPAPTWIAAPANVPLVKVVHPEQLVQTVRVRSHFLPEKKSTAAQPIPPASPFKSVSETERMIQNKLKQAVESLEAARVSVFSLRPKSILENRFPSEVSCLVASQTFTPRQKFSSELFPQMQVAWEDEQSLLLSEPLPEVIGKHKRSGMPGATAVVTFPGANGKSGLAVLIEYSGIPRPEAVFKLELAPSIFRKTQRDLETLDFFARVYG